MLSAMILSPKEDDICDIIFSNIQSGYYGLFMHDPTKTVDKISEWIVQKIAAQCSTITLSFTKHIKCNTNDIE